MRPCDRERGGADYKRTRMTITIGPVSAILSTTTLESTAGPRRCVGRSVESWGVGTLGMARLGSGVV